MHVRVNFLLWFLFMIFALMIAGFALRACKLQVPFTNIVLQRCPEFIVAPALPLVSSAALRQELQELQLAAVFSPLCSTIDSNNSRIEALRDVTGTISDLAELTETEVTITIADHNSALDDVYDLVVNGSLIGEVRISQGGQVSYSTTLLKGDNLVQLKLKQERGKNTLLKINIEPGGFSQDFQGSKDHNYRVTVVEN